LREVIRALARIRGSERGAVYVEYVVLAALATLVILGAVQLFFNGISALFQRIGGSLSGL
jgi:Flp pilus assembly pilin Flp